MIWSTAILLMAAGLGGGGENAAPAVTFKVMSYNIRHGRGMDDEVNLSRIAEVVRRENPDVVCFQEVDRGLSRTSRKDIARILGEKLNMEPVFGPNYFFDDGEYGNATLSRLPIVDHENLALPGPVSVEPRGCLRVTVLVEGREVDVWNTHFGLRPGERRAQAEAVIAALRERPTLVVGDINEEFEAPGMQLLLAHLRDTFAKNKGEAAHTSSTANPRRRIDFILATPHFETNWFKILHDPLTEIASDHFPLIAELRLEKAADSNRATRDAE